MDITGRKRAEETLRMSQKLESLGVLAGGIAHDFNNLLTAMMGNLNLAQMRLEEGSPAAPLLHKVEATVMKAAELAHQMLAYSGRGAFKVEQVDLNQVVEEMTELLSVSISKKAALHIRLARGLPAIHADSVQIQQVVMNLVTNASEALGDRQGDISIETEAEDLDAAYLAKHLPSQNLAPGPHVVLAVKDTGCGMDPDTQARIFDPFFTTKTTGRGLGLSAMAGILSGHGAGILIESEVGRGSAFRIFFPALGAGSRLREPAREADPAQELTGTILVVDDEPMVRSTVVGVIEALGMHALEAGDGVDALDVYRRHRQEIDLVFMDITMPRMDGNETFLAIRQQDPALPVILCSGFTSQEVVQPPPGTRPADFVHKPYRVNDLKKAIQQSLHTPYTPPVGVS
jgi:nitrogen-specific signal transduction histidine kinase/ActR/RegA family two-component response regulator